MLSPGDEMGIRIYVDNISNATEQDIKDALPSIVESEFSDFKFIYNPKAKDLYFWGIKK